VSSRQFKQIFLLIDWHCRLFKTQFISVIIIMLRGICTFWREVKCLQREIKKRITQIKPFKICVSPSTSIYPDACTFFSNSSEKNLHFFPFLRNNCVKLESAI